MKLNAAMKEAQVTMMNDQEGAKKRGVIAKMHNRASIQNAAATNNNQGNDTDVLDADETSVDNETGELI